MTEPMQWLYQPGQDVSLVSGSRVILRYHLATDRRKPFLHPVSTADGVVLTCLEPWDHVWHRGLWFAWKYLNGVNYWEETAEGAEDGRTEFDGDEVVRLGPEQAEIQTVLHYRTPQGQTVLTEHRTVSIGLPDARGAYRLDWLHTFHAAAEPVEIDRTPINDATPWGGYAGLSWRSARSLGKFQALDSEGRRNEAVEHQRARWVDLSGASDGGRDLVGGIAMFDHPDNPRYPTHWRCILNPGFGYINPAFVLAEPYQLAPATPLTLRYRVLVHPGWGDAEQMEAEFARFVAGAQRPAQA